MQLLGMASRDLEKEVSRGEFFRFRYEHPLLFTSIVRHMASEERERVYSTYTGSGLCNGYMACGAGARRG